jgi:hypothetical protein
MNAAALQARLKRLGELIDGLRGKDGAFVIACEDDRLERWTPVGKRMVVENWYPGSRVPVATAVLGIAEPIR